MLPARRTNNLHNDDTSQLKRREHHPYGTLDGLQSSFERSQAAWITGGHGNERLGLLRRSSSAPGAISRYAERADIEVPLSRVFGVASNLLSGGVFHPMSFFRTFWSLCTCIMLIFVGFVAPFRLAFPTQFNFGWFIFFRFLNLYWMLDLLINFNTAILDNEHLVLNRRKIAIHYVKGWLLPDVWVCLPLDMILETGHRPGGIMISRILQLIAVVRLAKLDGYLTDFTITLRLRHLTEKLMKLIISGVFVAHFFACGMVLVGQLQLSHGLPNWISVQKLDPTKVSTVYVAALYWSMATVSTVGYGDIVAQTFVERVYNLFAMIMGAGSFAFIVTSIVGFIGHVSRRNEEFNQKLDSVNSYIRLRKLPSALAQRIRKFHILAYQGSIHELHHEKEILDELPISLKRKLAVHVSKQLCQWSNFFSNSEPLFCLDLLLAMTERYVPAGELIIFHGEICEEMFLIEEGQVEVIFSCDTANEVLEAGNYFGIDVVISDTKTHSMTIRSTSWVKLRVLHVDELFAIIWRHESVRNELLNTVHSRDVHAVPHDFAARSMLKQSPLIPFLKEHWRSVEKRIVSKFIFRPGSELCDSGSDLHDGVMGDGLIDIAAVQESILHLNLSSCTELMASLNSHIAELDRKEQAPSPVPPHQLSLSPDRYDPSLDSVD